MATGIRDYMETTVRTLHRPCQNAPCTGTGVLSIGFDTDDPGRVLELFCSPACRDLAQRRRQQLRTALRKIDQELATPRVPTPRLRLPKDISEAERRRRIRKRQRDRKPTKKELNLWRRRIMWELDALDRRPTAP